MLVNMEISAITLNSQGDIITRRRGLILNAKEYYMKNFIANFT